MGSLPQLARRAVERGYLTASEPWSASDRGADLQTLAEAVMLRAVRAGDATLEETEAVLGERVS